MIDKIILLSISLVVLVVSFILFKKASGTLNIFKMNLISFSFYTLIVFDCIGAICVLLGYRDHYLIERITEVDTVNKTCIFLAYAMIALPLFILIINKLCIRGSIKETYDSYLKKDTVVTGDDYRVITIISVLLLLCIIATIYMFNCMGNFPILDALRGGDAVVLRSNASKNFNGNPYIKSIVVLEFAPLVSYLTYIYFRISKKNKKIWFVLFIISFLLSVIIKTYDLEKAPIIYYLFYYYIIEIILGNKHLKKLFVCLSIVFVVLICVVYLGLGYQSDFFTLKSGPLGRIIMTQVATLFLHVDAFPNKHAFLNGESFPTLYTKILGINDSWNRSGKIVMEIYNKKGVKAGTAGVMNAMFIGEAYANFGVLGVLIAPLIAAIPFALGYSFVLTQKKTPLTIVFYITLFSYLGTNLNGGFVDFVYNIALLAIIFIFILISLIVQDGKIKIRRGKNNI